ncbi:MAG: hypothetical protein KC619_25595 [Myxococcales bacterium]|nr:hypothetical protein [Myxococcales bacterium]
MRGGSFVTLSSVVSYAAGALVIAGCSTLFEYPRPRAESGSPACGDGFDNDFDGRIDCADLDCADSRDCTRREDPGDCRDEQDNDRDGYADRADPLCWHLWASDPWERCVTARTVRLDEDFDGPAATRWFSNDALAPRVVARPGGDDRTDTVAEIVSGPRAFSRATVSSLHGEVRLTAAWQIPVGSGTSLEIWSADATPSASAVRPSGLLGEVQLVRSSAGLELTIVRGVDRTGPVQVPDVPHADGWIPLVIDVRCGRSIDVRIGETFATAGSGDCYTLSTLPTYAPFGPLAGEALRVAVLATSGHAYLDDLSASALGTNTCERQLPRLSTGPGAVAPPTSPRVLSMALSGDPERYAGTDDEMDRSDCDPPEPYLCALVLDRGTGFVEPWVSHEVEGSAWPRLGMQFTRGAPLPPGSVMDASVEWTWMGSCMDQRWRATLRTRAGLSVYESEDCETWTAEAYVPADLEGDWSWHAYFVRAAFGDQRIPQREEMYVARRGTTGLVFGRASRPRNTLTWTGVSVVNGDRPAAELADLTFPITLSRIGTIDQILTGHGPELGLVVHVVPAGIGEEVLAWQGGGLNAFEYTGVIAPSGLPGTTDRWDIESGAVSVARESDGNLFALALYTADGDHRTVPDGHSSGVGIACRQIGRRNPPCEPPDRIPGPGSGDGFCFRGETCLNAPANDCGLECDADGNPQDLTQVTSDRPATTHPTAGGAFTFVADESPIFASAPLRAGPVRSGVHFDVLLDGSADECAVRLGVGHAAPVPDGRPVGEMAEIGLEGDLVRFRAFSRERDTTEARSEDVSRIENHRGRWQHVLLLRTEEGIQVWGRELDIPNTWELHATAPRGPADSSTLWIELPGTTESCRGRIRNVVVDEAQAPPP